MSNRARWLILLAWTILLPLPAAGQDSDVPYWASIHSETANMRVGPGAGFPIDWVYRRPGLPVKVVRVMQGWRLVRDPDGTQGWIVGRLLSRDRGAIVVGSELADLREDASSSSTLRWRVQPGVVGLLGDCADKWCEFNAGGKTGWIAQDRIWGAGQP